GFGPARKSIVTDHSAGRFGRRQSVLILPWPAPRNWKWPRLGASSLTVEAGPDMMDHSRQMRQPATLADHRPEGCCLRPTVARSDEPEVSPVTDNIIPRRAFLARTAALGAATGAGLLATPFTPAVFADPPAF